MINVRDEQYMSQTEERNKDFKKITVEILSANILSGLEERNMDTCVSNLNGQLWEQLS